MSQFIEKCNLKLNSYSNFPVVKLVKPSRDVISIVQFFTYTVAEETKPVLK